MSAKEEFFKRKIAALLHDPPNKAWIVAKKIHHEGGHKGAAKDLANRLFGGEISRLVDAGEITAADSLAASFDRWILSMVGGEYLFEVEEVGYTNLFSQGGHYAWPLDRASTETAEFISELKRALKGLREGDDWRLTYHVLYALYEYLWHSVNPGCAGPADTRVPTHTVFDHAYATTAAVNLVATPEHDSFMVCLDLAGPQRFIQASRKLRDMWAASWLASLLAWCTVEPLIRAFGPDILLLPSARGNPFYFHTVLAKLATVNSVAEETRHILKSAAKDVSGLDLEAGFPRYAVIPATVTLLLPHPGDAALLEQVAREISEEQGFEVKLETEEGIAAFLRDTYTGLWRKIVEAAVRSLRVFPAFSALEEIMRDLGVYDNPPLPTRIIVKPVKVGGANDRTRYLTYHSAFKAVSDALAEAGLLKVHHLAGLRVTDFTQNYEHYSASMGSGERRFYMCSVCGEAPALPWTPDLARYLNCIEEGLVDFEWTDESQGKWSGERLCPYCLVKRLFLTNTVFNEILRETLGQLTERVAPPRIPSVSTVATIGFKEAVAKAWESDPSLAEHIKGLLGARELRFPSTFYAAERRLLRIVENGRSKSQDHAAGAELLEAFIMAPSEDLLLKDHETRRRANQLGKAIVKKPETEEPPPLDTYFVLVKGDGDDVGKVLTGSLSDVSALRMGDIFMHMASITPNSRLKEVLKSLSKEDLKSAEALIDEERLKHPTRADVPDLHAMHKSMEETLKEPWEKEDEKKWMSRILVSPAYHTAISRALMTTANKAAEAVEEADGVVVYSGGDDILAVLPTRRAVDVTKEIRKVYHGASRSGFNALKIGDRDAFVIPSMGDLGQSFAIVHAHYHYPLSFTTREVVALQESSKNSVWTRIDRGGSFKKDSLTISYLSRGGNPLKGVLPLREVKDKRLEFLGVVEQLGEALRYLETGVLSRNLLQDLQAWLERIHESCKVDREAPQTILMHIIRRNLDKMRPEPVQDEALKKTLGFFADQGLALERVRKEPEERKDPYMGRDEVPVSLLTHVLNALHACMGARRGWEA